MLPRKLIVLLPVFFVSAVGASQASFGYLPVGNSTYSTILGISPNGEFVTGTMAVGSSYHSFIFERSSGLLFDQPMASYSNGNAVNNDRRMVGSGITTNGFEALIHTAPWGGVVRLGDFAGGAFESSATGISSAGVVVGFGTKATGREAFRTTATNELVGLGSLVLGGTSEAKGITPNGSVIYGTSSSSFQWGEAFRWTTTSGMVGLGSLHPVVGGSTAYDASSNGNVIVGSSNSTNGTQEAFKWTLGQGMVGLGDLPGGGFYSFANGTSEDGKVTVGFSDGNNGSEAFFHTTETGMVSLRDTLVAAGLQSQIGFGFHLENARDVYVSGNMMTIFGDASNGNIRKGYVATVPVPVPEPVSVISISIGMLSLLRKRSKNKD